jgi:DNA-binding beta-propeller fold protein YncE
VRRVSLLTALLFFGLLLPLAQTARRDILLPTSKVLTTPVPGWSGRLNNFPATIALSPDGHYAAFLNDGYGSQETAARQSIAVLNLDTNQLSDFPDARFAENAHQSYFLGLVFSTDGGHLYASVGSITDAGGEKEGNTGNGIAIYEFKNGKISPERFIKIPPQKLASGKKVAYGLRKTDRGTAIPYPAGLTVVRDQEKDELLIADNLSDNVIRLDTTDGRILQTFDLSTSDLVPSAFPYAVVVSRDGRRAWCSLWNASRVAELDLNAGRVARWIPLLEPKDPIAPGSHPSAMLLSPDEKLLYVALANADAVAVISTTTDRPPSYLETRPNQRYAGSYPNALAMSADGKHLFLADASLNAVAVFDFSKMLDLESENGRQPPMGFIPTEWYPSALAVRGNDLLIATAKGQGSGPDNGPNRVPDPHRHREHPYIATLMNGSIARLKISAIEKNLADYTREVEQDNLFHSDPGKIVFAHGENPIRHVIYVIKENRAYDQILGDLKVGNGDPSLTMYGEDITPNQHKLARQFGVLDNFYDSGEVSGDGHQWSTAAITSDYNEKTWQIAYRGKERTYDFQGTVADEFMLDYNLPDVDDPATGFLWDNVARHGLTYRDYGEFVDAVWCERERIPSPRRETRSPLSVSCAKSEIGKGEALPPNVGQPHASPSPWPWGVPLMDKMKPTKALLRDHFDPNYPDFNVDYPDQLRADEFLHEFDGFVHARKKGTGTGLPAFVLLYLPDDHTGGTRPGKPRPQASVADNDLALGRVVDAVSHSPYWDDTAIFVVEDDAQNGFDHVDAHRSIAFAISKYSPGSYDKPFVAHGFYTTVNLIHTMEELLGLPPMNQNDAYAPIMAPLFTGEGNQPAFSADFRNQDNGLIYQTNPKHESGAKESSRMDFSRPDAADAEQLNAVLWRDCKGNAPMPTPIHTIVAGGVRQ